MRQRMRPALAACVAHPPILRAPSSTNTGLRRSKAASNIPPLQKMAQLVDKAKEFFADKLAHVKKPEADLTDVSVKRLGRDGATFHGLLSVRNPYDHAIPICEVSYSLHSAGREIASGTMPDPGSLIAKDETQLDLPIKVPYDFLVNLMRDLGRDWDMDYELKVGLTVDLPIIGNFTLPLGKKGEIKLPSLSDIF